MKSCYPVFEYSSGRSFVQCNCGNRQRQFVGDAVETVSPTLQSAAAVTDRSLSATFSEPMLAPGSTTPGSYAVSGMCTGSSLPSPTGVSGGPATFTLDWAAGEMRNGVLLTLTTSGMQDALGNPINPAANNVSLTGKGTAPVFSDLTVMPPEAAVGDGHNQLYHVRNDGGRPGSDHKRTSG